MNNKTEIVVETTVEALVEEVWKWWTDPEHIKKWNHASNEWHTPKAENDLLVGGRFECRMEAKDGSMGFDFGGTYDDIKTNELIKYTLDDGRKVAVTFSPRGNFTKISETFEAEHVNDVEMQRSGWQAILDNFKRYAESKGELA